MSQLTPLESDLLSRVRDHQDSDALSALIDLHTGIYYKVVSTFSRIYPDVIKMRDMDDDRMTNMYKWIIDYKPEKERPLGEYLGYRAEYHCRDLLKAEMRDVLSPAFCATLPSGDATAVSYVVPSGENEATEADAITTSYGFATAIDTTPSARPAEAAADEVGLQDILKVVDDPASGVDPRFRAILEMRNLTTPALTWRQIGVKVGLSYEMARIIYNRNMVKVRELVTGVHP